MLRERYRPHDELIVFTRRKRSVNRFFRWAMCLITGFALLLALADLGGSSESCMGRGFGTLVAIAAWMLAMPACAIAWAIALGWVSHAKFRPYWKCACGYDLRGTMAGGITRCPECGRTKMT